MDIFKEILRALESEECVMLATIISTSGSTPASALSKMLIKNKYSSVVGTVGGGCMEADVAEHAKILSRSGIARIVSYRLVEDGIEQGLICGGTLDILIEPVTRESIPLLERLRKIREGGEDCVLSTLLNDEGKVIDKRVIVGHDRVQAARERDETKRIKTEEGEFILELLPGRPALIIFGGGHISKYITRIAAMAGFGVTVIDDREMFANPERFPEAGRTITAQYEEAFDLVTITPSTYIVIVTRGHRYDEEVLEKAVKTEAKYVGMIGSRRKVITIYRHLVERGAPVELLGKVKAPMGLDIGAVTGEEIAVSIVSELIKLRRTPVERTVSEKIGHKSDVMIPILDKLEKEKQIYSSK